MKLRMSPDLPPEFHASPPPAPENSAVSKQEFHLALAQMGQQHQQAMQSIQQVQEFISRLAITSTTAPSGAPHSSQLPSTRHVTPSPHVLPGFMKMQRPSVFKGELDSNVDTWLFEVETYITAYGVTDDAQKIAFATAYLKGLAVQWWQSRCSTFPGQTISWDQFRKEVRERFQPIEASRTARVHLRGLQQGRKTISQYCSAFYEQVQLIHDMSEADKMEHFMFGLNSEVYEEVDRMDPGTLHDAMLFAQRVEMRGRVRAARRGTTYNAPFRPNRFTGNYRSSNHMFKNSHAVNNGHSSAVSTTPMEIGSVDADEENDDVDKDWEDYVQECDEADQEHDQSDGGENDNVELAAEDDVQLNAISSRGKKLFRLPKEEFIRLRNEGRCFRCKQVGHFGKSCPNQSKLKRTSKRLGTSNR